MVLEIIVLVFAGLAAIDYFIGNKFKIGKEFERGFQLLGQTVLSMVGMIVLAPLFASLLAPLFEGFYKVFSLDPSIIPSSLFANDMGGYSLSVSVAIDGAMGKFNGLVVSSMMGCTISFTIPFALTVVGKEQHRPLIFGLLCGIITIPLGCFVGGLVCGLNVVALLLNLIPLLIFAAILVTGLLLFPNACVKVFTVFGMIMKAMILAGLLMGCINFLFKREVIPGLGTIEEGAIVCINAAIVMAGMLPLLAILALLLKKPLKLLGVKTGVNEASALGVFSSLATSMTTFASMKAMDEKGTMLNAAFAVSGAFTFAGHMAFTMAYDGSYVPAVIVGKLTAGILALALAFLLYGKLMKGKNGGDKAPTEQTEGLEQADVAEAVRAE